MPGGHLFTNLGRVLWLTEGTYGTDSIDLANNLAVARSYGAVREIDITPNAVLAENPRVRGSGSREAHCRFLDNQSITMTGPFTGAITEGGAGTEMPPFGDVLRAAGLSETLVSATSATYKPSTTAEQSMTVYHWRRGAEAYKFRLMYCTGVRGNLEVNFTLHEEATWTFTGESNNLPESTDTAAFDQGVSDELAYFDANGLIDLQKTGAAITYTGAETYSDAPKFCGDTMAFTLDSQALQAKSITYNLNREVVKVQELNGTQSTAKVLSLPGACTIDIVLSESAAGFEKVMDLVKSQAEVSYVHTHSLGSGNDLFTATHPKVQVDPSGPVRQANGSIIEHSFRLISNGNFAGSILGDNDFTWVWSTAA